MLSQLSYAPYFAKLQRRASPWPLERSKGISQPGSARLSNITMHRTRSGVTCQRPRRRSQSERRRANCLHNMFYWVPPVARRRNPIRKRGLVLTPRHPPHALISLTKINWSILSMKNTCSYPIALFSCQRTTAQRAGYSLFVIG